MTDRELLEKAAKAAGFGDVWYVADGETPYIGKKYKLGEKPAYTTWSPLTDDGDALRLAVQLNIPVIPYDDETSTGTVGVVAKNWGGKEANTRRAIVRAAAELGKNIGEQ